MIGFSLLGAGYSANHENQCCLYKHVKFDLNQNIPGPEMITYVEMPVGIWYCVSKYKKFIINVVSACRQINKGLMVYVFLFHRVSD